MFAIMASQCGRARLAYHAHYAPNYAVYMKAVADFELRGLSVSPTMILLVQARQALLQ